MSKSAGKFFNISCKSIFRDFWRNKPRNSWTSRRDTLMRLAFLESEDFFTSNGFFRIRKILKGKNFTYFALNFARTLFIVLFLVRPRNISNMLYCIDSSRDQFPGIFSDSMVIICWITWPQSRKLSVEQALLGASRAASPISMIFVFEIIKANE